jgi:hypothetical protein
MTTAGAPTINVAGSNGSNVIRIPPHPGADVPDKLDVMKRAGRPSGGDLTTRGITSEIAE